MAKVASRVFSRTKGCSAAGQARLSSVSQRSITPTTCRGTMSMLLRAVAVFHTNLRRESCILCFMRLLLGILLGFRGRVRFGSHGASGLLPPSSPRRQILLAALVHPLWA